MRFFDYLYFSHHTIRTHRLRTFLTISGVVIGIGAILIFLSLGYGLRTLTVTQITKTDALRLLHVQPGSSKTVHLDSDGISNIAAIDGVESISPLLHFSAKVTFQKTTTEAIVTGINPSFQEVEFGFVSEGENLNDPKEKTVIISRTLMSLLGVDSVNDILGKSVRFQLFVPKPRKENEFQRVERVYTVKGIFEGDESLLVTSVNTFFDLPFGDFHGLKVRVEDREVFDSVRAQIGMMGYEVSAPADTLAEVNTIFQIVEVILAFFGMIALFVAAIGMFNTMTISLLERTHEIGVMKAIGATNRDIRLLFLFESMMLSGAGGLIGIVLSLALGEGLNAGIAYLARTLGGEVVRVFVTPWDFVVGLFAVSLILGFFTGLLPSHRAGRLDPIEALRYE